MEKPRPYDRANRVAVALLAGSLLANACASDTAESAGRCEILEAVQGGEQVEQPEFPDGTSITGFILDTKTNGLFKKTTNDMHYARTEIVQKTDTGSHEVPLPPTIDPNDDARTSITVSLRSPTASFLESSWPLGARTSLTLSPECISQTVDRVEHFDESGNLINVTKTFHPPVLEIPLSESK